MKRRHFVAALAAWPLSALAGNGGEALLAGFQRWGSGEYRRFGFLVYEATLWAGGEDPLLPPLALKLTYQRRIAGSDIAQASVREIRNLGLVDEARLLVWGEQMRRLFPDVGPGDRILGLYQLDGARFYFNERLLGSIADPAFARAFFAIWLDARSSAPDLRAALLKRTPA